MARGRSPTLTDGETRMMAVLWDKERATVADVVAALKSRRPVTYSTVQTMLRILEEKGYVAHDKSGRAFVYRPIVDHAQARRRALGHLVTRFFNNSPSLVVHDVLADERINADEISRLKKMIGDA